MNKLLKCGDYNPNLEHNISVNTSRKNNLKKHGTINQSNNELVHKISV